MPGQYHRQASAEPADSKSIKDWEGRPLEMCNTSLNGGQQTAKAEHIHALACTFHQPRRPSRKSLPACCSEKRIEMAVLQALAMKRAASLTYHRNSSTLSLYSASQRQIIGRREVARIYESDLV